MGQTGNTGATLGPKYPPNPLTHLQGQGGWGWRLGGAEDAGRRQDLAGDLTEEDWRWSPRGGGGRRNCFFCSTSGGRRLLCGVGGFRGLRNVNCVTGRGRGGFGGWWRFWWGLEPDKEMVWNRLIVFMMDPSRVLERRDSLVSWGQRLVFYL